MKNKYQFKTPIAEHIFYNKYALTQSETWQQKSITIVDSVCGTAGGTKDRVLLSKSEQDFLAKSIEEFKFLPGGRYIYYAGRKAAFYNNCYIFISQEDSREDWSDLSYKATAALMTGGGIGNDYSCYRPSGRLLSKTGGISSGPIPAMSYVNEIGRNVQQGGSRRSAIYASLNWMHEDSSDFLVCKNWYDMPVGNTGFSIGQIKEQNFNYNAPLDMTNVSLNYDNKFLDYTWGTDNWYEENGLIKIKEERTPILHNTFVENVFQALSTGEPGFSFNFGSKEKETGRNACTEVTSSDDCDVCNLGSINIGSIDTIEEFRQIVNVASKFLVCGTIRADLPFDRIKQTREKNRRLGLGLMGVHEWLLKRKYRYEVVPELHEWLKVWKEESEKAANEHCDRLYLNRPIAYRSIAPTGTIGLLAASTTGIEPLYAVSYKRRYLAEGTKWKYEYVVDSTAEYLINEYGLDPNNIETAVDLAKDYERRIKFQADIQEYVDMAISSTINLPGWGEKGNDPDKLISFSSTLAKYAHRLRGFTCYPDGARGGQPITSVSYKDAISKKGVVFEEHEEKQCKSGVCGI